MRDFFDIDLDRDVMKHTKSIVGGMAEWSKAADLRSVGRLSARVRTSLPSFFAGGLKSSIL